MWDRDRTKGKYPTNYLRSRPKLLDRYMFFDQRVDCVDRQSHDQKACQDPFVQQLLNHDGAGVQCSIGNLNSSSAHERELD